MNGPRAGACRKGSPVAREKTELSVRCRMGEAKTLCPEHQVLVDEVSRHRYTPEPPGKYLFPTWKRTHLERQT